jgi:ketosteroid isomerase-like protein
MSDARTLPAADQEILNVIGAWNEAFARNDPAAYFRYIDDDITVLTPSNPYRVEGVHDDREEFERGLASGAGRVGYFQELQPHVQRYGDVAVVTYFSRGAYGAEGSERTLYLKETDVLVRRSGGWKVVHIHVSSTP